MRRGGILLLMLAIAGSCVTTPTAEPRPEPPPPPGTVVVVEPGQTLWQIAQAAGITVDELAEANGLDAAEPLLVGQRIFVPAGARPTSPIVDVVAPPPPPPRTSQSCGPVSAAGLCWPVDGVVLRDFALPTRATAKRPAREGYDGLLIAAPAGTPVHAAGAGVVVFAGTQGTAYGTFVVVDHGDGLVAIYAHLRTTSVKVGQTVAPGDVVGEIGTSGLTGASPRVQFQLRKNEVPVDPLPLLPP
jgi:murein DD-endopeptidase MepM/ murein hydrolase activator NlpD